MAFEDRFRRLGPRHLEAWHEVVFWKLDSMAAWQLKKTRELIQRLRRTGVTAEKLWALCSDYVESPTKKSFAAFREKLFNGPVVATAATFPAFICPERFPMVDRQIAKWARAHGAAHSYAKSGGPELSGAPDLKTRVLNENDWPFVESWITWCRYTACLLSQRTEREWRARDVEMAVFTVQRQKIQQLEPLSRRARGSE